MRPTPIVLLCGVLLATSAAASDDEVLRGVALRLLDGLEAKESPCPPTVEAMRPGREAFCGTVELELRSFKSAVDDLMVDASVSGGEAPPTEKWYSFRGIATENRDGSFTPLENFDRRSYKIGEWNFSVSYYGGTKTAVVFYAVPFPTCRPGDSEQEPEGLVQPKVIPKSKKSPIFPEIARMARLEAVVYVKLRVGTDGIPRDACILKVQGAGQVGFEFAALQAAKAWRFEPAMLSGKEMEAPKTIRFDFNLQGK